MCVCVYADTNMYIRANNTLSHTQAQAANNTKHANDTDTHTNTRSVSSLFSSPLEPGTTSTQRIAVAACQSHEQLGHMCCLRAHRAGVRIVTGAAAGDYIRREPVVQATGGQGFRHSRRAEGTVEPERGRGWKGNRGLLCAAHRGFNEEHKNCAAVLRPGRRALLLAPLRLRVPCSRTILLCVCRGLLPTPPHRLWPGIRAYTAC